MGAQQNVRTRVAAPESKKEVQRRSTREGASCLLGAEFDFGADLMRVGV
jgi:hypothetical protein